MGDLLGEPLGFTIGEESPEVSTPKISLAGERLYNTSPALFSKDEETGWFGRYLCQSLMSMFQNLDGIVQDWPPNTQPITGEYLKGRGPYCGWSIITDPDDCPESWLEWCAKLYGVVLTEHTTHEEKVKQIQELPPQKRGGILAMETAGNATLKAGSKMFLYEQAGGNSYRIVAVTTPAQSAGEEAVTKAALLTQKPGGIELVYSSGNLTWNAALKTWGAVAGTVTWANAKPGEV